MHIVNPPFVQYHIPYSCVPYKLYLRRRIKIVTLVKVALLGGWKLVSRLDGMSLEGRLLIRGKTALQSGL